MRCRPALTRAQAVPLAGPEGPTWSTDVTPAPMYLRSPSPLGPPVRYLTAPPPQRESPAPRITWGHVMRVILAVMPDLVKECMPSGRQDLGPARGRPRQQARAADASTTVAPVKARAPSSSGKLRWRHGRSHSVQKFKSTSTRSASAGPMTGPEDSDRSRSLSPSTVGYGGRVDADYPRRPTVQVTALTGFSHVAVGGRGDG
jgi:hypothetical protein